LTLMMVGTGYVSLPKVLIVLLLVLAMLVKASLIGAHFMHLRFEKLSLVLTVAVGILATATILFLLISFDGIRILRLSLP
ncbi:MAG: cytochrome C oxidase subunit IV family protein, partial [Terriglobia bacterium]